MEACVFEANLQMSYGSLAALYRRGESDVQKLDQYLGALAKLEQKLPPTNRAAKYRRLLAPTRPTSNSSSATKIHISSNGFEPMIRFSNPNEDTTRRCDRLGAYAFPEYGRVETAEASTFPAGLHTAKCLRTETAGQVACSCSV